MATGSQREQILEYVVGQIEEIDRFKLIARDLPDDIASIPSTQFPACYVVGGLPVAAEHDDSMRPGGADVFLSQLDVVVFVWDRASQSWDTRISDLADDLWAKLWENPTKGIGAVKTSVFFGEIPTWNPPTVSFNLTVRVRYKHTIGGI